MIVSLPNYFMLYKGCCLKEALATPEKSKMTH